MYSTRVGIVLQSLLQIQRAKEFQGTPISTGTRTGSVFASTCSHRSLTQFLFASFILAELFLVVVTQSMGWTDALVGTLFTWGVTALGSALVFVIPTNANAKQEKALLDLSYGFAGGVMLAASFWSLLVRSSRTMDAVSFFLLP